MSDQYIRHSILPEIGVEGQNKLKNSVVGIVGAGGLGSPVIQYLSSMGVGKLIIVDDDVVEEVNLNRQVIHSHKTIGMKKAESAAKFVSELNPNIVVVPVVKRIDVESGVNILKDCNVLVDCCDNHETRYAISNIGVILGIPIVTGSVVRWEGHVTVLNYHGGPCYKCLYPVKPASVLSATAKTAGVVGMICGIIGSIEAMETIKILLGQGGLFF